MHGVCHTPIAGKRGSVIAVVNRGSQDGRERLFTSTGVHTVIVKKCSQFPVASGPWPGKPGAAEDGTTHASPLGMADAMTALKEIVLIDAYLVAKSTGEPVRLWDGRTVHPDGRITSILDVEPECCDRDECVPELPCDDCAS